MLHEKSQTKKKIFGSMEPCHLGKNCVAAVTKPCRTQWLGDIHCDFAHLNYAGCPMAAYQFKDGQILGQFNIQSSRQDLGATGYPYTFDAPLGMLVCRCR